MNKFDECYDIENLIVDRYLELFASSTYIDNIPAEISYDILELLLDEYEILHSLTLEEINLLLEKDLNDTEQYSGIVLDRIRNKLVDVKEIALGRGITSRELGISSIHKEMEFSFHDAILSMINIEIIKKLKNKINYLTSYSESDKRFVRTLYSNLEKSKINFLLYTGTSEVIALSNCVNIDMVPRIDINKINAKIKLISNNDKNIDSLVYQTVAVYVKRVIDSLAIIEYVDNNPKDVFRYLILVIQMEVLISYMDKEMLNTLDNYCSKIINLKNRTSIENVKRLIKNKIDI